MGSRQRMCAECKKWELGETWGTGSGSHGVAIESRGWCMKNPWKKKPRWNYAPVCASFDKRPKTGFMVCGQGWDAEAFEEIADNMQEMLEDNKNAENMEETKRDKSAEYAEVVGRRFRPTFQSPIAYFEIRGYDSERDMVLTIAHPKEGEPFNDEIEERYLMGAFENGDYKPIMPTSPSEPDTYVLHNYDIPQSPRPRQQKFTGPCCARCQHRFGSTSNSKWCESHWQNEKCYRFKLDK